MAQKFNTEFNYRYQVIGDTPWERIKTLKGFLEGRIRALALKEVDKLKPDEFYWDNDKMVFTEIYHL